MTEFHWDSHHSARHYFAGSNAMNYVMPAKAGKRMLRIPLGMHR
jgi:hypothetical protein